MRLTAMKADTLWQLVFFRMLATWVRTVWIEASRSCAIRLGGAPDSSSSATSASPCDRAGWRRRSISIWSGGLLLSSVAWTKILPSGGVLIARA